jgi:hypothetical protein
MEVNEVTAVIAMTDVIAVIEVTAVIAVIDVMVTRFNPLVAVDKRLKRFDIVTL